MRFDWLVKKDDFNSFGLKFHIFVVAAMCVSFFSMVKAVLAYHNRTRESLRMMFSLSSFLTVLMFLIILSAKIIVYLFRLKFEQTIHQINPTIVTSLIHMTEPRN